MSYLRIVIIKVKKMKLNIRINLLLLTVLLLTTMFFVPPVLSIPTNKVQCNTCHSVGGAGTLSATFIDGSRPANNIFVVEDGKNLIISLQGIGANEESTPAVALIFDNQIFHHVQMEGASAGGQGSFAFYVKDGDENDEDPEPGNVKGVFHISMDENGEPGVYDTVASFIQEGPSGISVALKMQVAGVSRETSSISMLVSPSVAYANKDYVFISGSIRPSDAEHVSIEYKIEDLWQVIESIKPSSEGLFFYSWKPEHYNEYSIRAVFEGNENNAPVQSTVFDVKVLKSSSELNSEILTAVLLGLGAMMLFSVLFYNAGRKKYNKRIALKSNKK